MKIIAIIPSRYNSSRFPGKPLALINKKPMIQWVYEKTLESKLLQKVFVATDDKRIYDKVVSFGGNAIMTSSSHTSGTERIAEAFAKINQDFDIILNIQGDEPMIQPEMIEKLVEGLSDPEVQVSTLKKEITDEKQIFNSDVAKVITDHKDCAIYFSRSTIPYNRDGSIDVKYFKHIGMYGYRAEFLRLYSNLKPAMVEEAEQLEQLKVIYNGYKIKVLEIFKESIGVDKPEHIPLIEKEFNNKILTD